MRIETSIKRIIERLYCTLLALPVAIRIAILVIPGNSIRTPGSGGGDCFHQVETVTLVKTDDPLGGGPYADRPKSVASRAPPIPRV